MKTGKALLAVVVALFSGTLMGLILSPGKDKNAQKKNSKKLEALAAELNRKIDQKFSELRMRINASAEKSGQDSRWQRKTETVR